MSKKKKKKENPNKPKMNKSLPVKYRPPLPLGSQYFLKSTHKNTGKSHHVTNYTLIEFQIPSDCWQHMMCLNRISQSTLWGLCTGPDFSSTPFPYTPKPGN